MLLWYYGYDIMQLNEETEQLNEDVGQDIPDRTKTIDVGDENTGRIEDTKGVEEIGVKVSLPLTSAAPHLC